MLLQSLRLRLISNKFLLDKIKLKYFLYESTECKQILHRALKYSSLEIDKKFHFLKYDDLSTRPRMPHELLLTVGGWSGGFPTNSIETYDSRSNTWLKLEDLDQGNNLYKYI